MRSEHAVLDIHTRVQCQFVHFAQDDALVGGLLGVFAHQHGPARIEGRIKIVVAAMDVQSVLGQGARADLQNHGGELAWRVIILLHGIDDSLTGSKVDRAAARHRIGGRATLRRVFAFAFDGDFLMPEDVELALGVGLLVNLAPFRRGGDRIKDSTVRDAGFDVLGDELIAITGDADARIFGGGLGGLGCGDSYFIDDTFIRNHKILSI